MFGDLFGNLEEKQAALRQELETIIVQAEAGDGAIKVSANANRELTNIAIDKSKLDWEDKDEVEDLLLVAVNRVLALAGEKEGEASQKLMQDMLPPGLGNLFGRG